MDYTQNKNSVLHICSDFSGQRIYDQLITSLSNLGISQTIYIPVRTAGEIGKYENPSLNEVGYHYSHILRPYHRIFFKLKVNKIFKDILKIVNLSLISKIHAHFLFSDGAVALMLKKRKGIPYIVCIRNTDINLFYKYMVHLRPLALEILKEAESIIFVTPSYHSLLLEKYITIKNRNQLASKMHIIPNGVEFYWLDHLIKKDKKPEGILKLLYVGDFSPNKNILTLLKCVKKLNNSGIESMLTLVGGGGKDEAQILKLVDSNPMMAKYLGRQNVKESLLKIYREHDIFVMASIKETFGVVYLEAMTQGLPIIYTENQGIDGYFDNGKVGFAVNPLSTSDIVEKITMILRDYEKFSLAAYQDVQAFNWKKISNAYLNLYQS